MDNLASSMHCKFSRNSNSVSIKSSGEISVELPSSSTKDLAKHQFFTSLPKSVEATGVEKAAGFVQGIETAGSNSWCPEPAFWLWSSCAKHPGGGSDAIVLNYSSPHYSYPAMQHPFSGICPSSSWQEVQLEPQGKGLAQQGEGGTDVERLVGSGCQHHSQGKMTQKATPLVLNCTFSDGWSANSPLKNKIAKECCKQIENN